MKCSKVNHQSTNTSLVAVCSQVSQDIEFIGNGLLHNSFDFEEYEFIERGYLQDEEKLPLPFKQQISLDQNGINFEKEKKDDFYQKKNGIALSDILDFSFFVPKQVDASLESLVYHIENKPYYLDYNLPEEEPFQQMSDYECRIKQEYSYSGQQKEINIENAQVKIEESSDKIEKFQNDYQQSESEDDFINGMRRIKKNVNMPKAIARYLMKNYQNYEKSLFKEYKELYILLSKDVKLFKIWKRKDKNNCFKLNHLTYLFSDPERRKLSLLNRLMMRKILSKNTRKQIVPSNQVKDKLEYLVASKVYSLRCANQKLASRMQMR